jgi:hypothetical protein
MHRYRFWLKYLIGGAGCGGGIVGGILTGNRWEAVWAGIALLWLTSSALYESADEYRRRAMA